VIHPFANNKTSLAVYSLVWLIIALIQFLVLNYFLEIDFISALLDSVLFNMIMLLFGLTLWYPTKFIDIEERSSLTIFTNHGIGAVVTSGIWIALSYLVLSKLIIDNDYSVFLKSSLVWRFLIGLLFYIIIVSIYYLIIYYNNFREKLKIESELNSLVKEAELRSLKYQINPHFIFNSLNSISALTISDPEKAREMTINLSTFLRGTLSKNENQKTRLSEELKNVKLYLEIEKVRFEGKFELYEELTEECLNLEVPNMLLQPLFENAIKHGVYESLDLVTIKIACKKESEYLRISVTNNFDKDAAPRKGEGIGLKNIENRLKLIYNRDNLLRVNKTENSFAVDIFIPTGG